MKINYFLSLFILLEATTSVSQVKTQLEAMPAKDFAGTLNILSSDSLEGREIGTKGNAMAADYVASMMESQGLLPFGDTGGLNGKRSYLQQFGIRRYNIDTALLELYSTVRPTAPVFQLQRFLDYTVEPGAIKLETEAPLVFAGYGIYAPGKPYNDYQELDIRNKVVIVLNGSQGSSDTTSNIWKTVVNEIGEEKASIGYKMKIAKWLGAIALIEVRTDVNPVVAVFTSASSGQSDSMSAQPVDPVYVDDYYMLPGDTATDITCLRMGSASSRKLIEGSGIDLAAYERNRSSGKQNSDFPVLKMQAKIIVGIKSEIVGVRNILGLIPGKDTSKYVAIGAHYDHLGMRNGQIYNGTDDNASGVAAMLTIARHWTEAGEKPPCNLVFAAWTAEEKGLLGSRYFARHGINNSENVLLYINMDMVSRSAPEDTLKQILSVGTLPECESLRSLANKQNLLLETPFQLDLWDVTGHTGSDYASFTESNIPVITFFSGFHDDYHSPRDIYPKADLAKMAKIITLINSCLNEFLLLIPNQ